MLDALESIHWSSLQHAYGSAANVPDLLRALASADAKGREEAIYELFGNIWHQGTVYSATAAAVPFLYELLNAPETLDKSSIAGLLACIASGRGYLEVHANDDFGERRWHRILAEKGKSLGDEKEMEKMVTQAVREAAASGLPGLIPYLRDPEPENRRVVAEAMRDYTEHASTSVPALKEAIDIESNKPTLRSMKKALADLEKNCVETVLATSYLPDHVHHPLLHRSVDLGALTGRRRFCSLGLSQPA